MFCCLFYFNGATQAAFNFPTTSYIEFHTFLKLVTFSLNRPSGPIQSISRDVRLSACLSVCMSPLVRYRLNVFLPPFTKVLGKIVFGFLDSLGKSYATEVVSDFAILAQKWSKIAARKKSLFWALF